MMEVDLDKLNDEVGKDLDDAIDSLYGAVNAILPTCTQFPADLMRFVWHFRIALQGLEETIWNRSYEVTDGVG